MYISLIFILFCINTLINAIARKLMMINIMHHGFILFLYICSVYAPDFNKKRNRKVHHYI